MYFVHYFRGTCGNFITRNINNVLDLDCFKVSPLGNCHFSALANKYKHNFLLKGNNYLNDFFKNNVIDKQFAINVENDLDYNFLLNHSKENKIINITYCNEDILQLNYNFFVKYYLDITHDNTDEFKTIHKINNSANNLTKEEYVILMLSLIRNSLNNLSKKNKIDQLEYTAPSRVFNLKFKDIMYFSESAIDSLYNFIDNGNCNKVKFKENFLSYQKKQTYISTKPITFLDLEKENLDSLTDLIKSNYETYLKTVKFKNEIIDNR